DAFIRNAKHVAEGDVEALHRTRVASRRLRELVPILKLDGDTAQTLTRRLRKVTKQLGTVREFDVLMALVKELEQDTRYQSSALRQIEAELAVARSAAHAHLSAKLPFAKVQRLARRLERAVKRRESEDKRRHSRSSHWSKRAWLWALDARVAHRATRVRTAI